MQYVTLNSGFQLPLVGFGTWRLTGYETILAALDAALQSGYRYFDSASVYANEADIQRALVGDGGLLRKHNLTRDDIIITSKLWTADIENAEDAINLSLKNFGGRIDLYLIHFPGKYMLPKDDVLHKQARREAWQCLEKAKEKGMLREIGISNYMQHHIEDLLTYCKVVPAVNQCERHPLNTQNDLISFCEKSGIHFQAYSSLGSSPGDANNLLFSSDIVKRIADKHGVSISRVLLRYSVQRGVSVLPKSTNPKHIATNIDLFNFTLEDEEIKQLDAMNQGTCFFWDPRPYI